MSQLSSDGGEIPLNQDPSPDPDAAPTPPADPAPDPDAPSDPPAWQASVPERFVRDTPEETIKELAKAYKHAEREFHAKADADNPFETKAKAAGLKTADLVGRYQNDGKLTDGQYAKLKAAGLDKWTVDKIMQAESATVQQAANLRSQVTTEIDKVVTSASLDKDAVLSWAETNMPADESDALVDMVSGPNATPATARLATTMLVARYKDALGASTNAPIVPQNGGKPTADKGFASQEEVRKAFSDPRIRTDPAYAREMGARLAASDPSVRGM